MRDETRHLSVTFCEDVRLEITGQTSHIGIFNGTLVTQSFPMSLPKFSVAVEISTPVDEQLQSLRFELTSDDGQVLVSQDFPSELLQQQRSVAQEEAFVGAEERRVGFRTQFIVAPLSLNEATMLRSRIVTEKGEVKGSSLRVVQGNPFIPNMHHIGG